MGKALLFSRGTIEMPNNIRLSAIRNVIAIFLLLTICAAAIGAGEYKPVFENSADFPLMGDWEGKWIDPLYLRTCPPSKSRGRESGHHTVLLL